MASHERVEAGARARLAQLVAQTIDTLAARGVTLPTDVAAYRGESFTVRGSGPGRRSGPINAVNAYQQELQSAYRDWADDLAQEAADEEDEEERRRKIEAALAVLAALLIDKLHRGMSQAFTDGLGGATINPAMLAYLAAQMERVDGLITSSLIPAIRDKLYRNLMTQDLAIALEAGQGQQALYALLDTVTARVGQYSGEWWAVYNHIHGAGASGPVAWYLDPNAQHCQDCPRYGSPMGRRYESYEAMLRATGGKSPASGVECGSNCRCEVRRVR